MYERIERIKKRVIVDHYPICIEKYRITADVLEHSKHDPAMIQRGKMLKAYAERMPIAIADDELIVGLGASKPMGLEIDPNYGIWTQDEIDSLIEDGYIMDEQDQKDLQELNKHHDPATQIGMQGDIFYEQEDERILKLLKAGLVLPPWKDKSEGRGVGGGYAQSGLGLGPSLVLLLVDYTKILENGTLALIDQAKECQSKLRFTDAESIDKFRYYRAVVMAFEAINTLADRYSALAFEMAEKETDPVRKEELKTIGETCAWVPRHKPRTFREAIQCFWFQFLMLSPSTTLPGGRFDQYMYPYYKSDMEAGNLTREFAQELMDCIWVKLNDLNKCRDAASAEGFAGYSLFQNLIAGGQNKDGEDVTNDLSFMCIQASMHVHLPAPSLSVRVWNGSPHEFLIKAAELTRTGIGLPAYYNDEVIIPALQNRGLSLADAREYNIIGCVEPQKAGKTDGWHDAAFFNMCRPLEMVFSNGMDKGVQIGVRTGDVTEMKTFDEFYDAYKKQMEYFISLLVNADNAIDVAHAERCPLPFLSCMVDDCMKRGKSVQEGGAVYNFTGPQGFGIANMADSLYAIRKLVYEEKKVTMEEMKEALAWNYGKGIDAQSAADITTIVMQKLQENGIGVNEQTAKAVMTAALGAEPSPEKKARFEEIHKLIDEVPKYGNDIPDVDYFARDVAYTYTKPLQKYKNPRGGHYQAGLYPVSANVPLGGQTGATPDGRYAHTPVADGVSPSAGKDVKGPTAAATSVSRLDHFIVSNGTLFNQKFHPSALAGREGLEKFVALIRGYFDQKGMHMQFNVVDRETLLDAQKHPEKYKHLVVRVAGYSALFTTLSRSLQDDIIRRTEQGF